MKYDFRSGWKVEPVLEKEAAQSMDAKRTLEVRRSGLLNVRKHLPIMTITNSVAN